jgi:hypothetical protein
MISWWHSRRFVDLFLSTQSTVKRLYTIGCASAPFQERSEKQSQVLQPSSYGTPLLQFIQDCTGADGKREATLSVEFGRGCYVVLELIPHDAQTQ